MTRVLMVGLFLFATAFAAPALSLAQRSPATLAQLAGTWTSTDWGDVVLSVDGSGTYASTYGTGPGRMSVHPVGGRRFAGTWGESAQRHGTLTLELSLDGRTITGTWTPDPHCTVGTTTGGTITWTRR